MPTFYSISSGVLMIRSRFEINLVGFLLTLSFGDYSILNFDRPQSIIFNSKLTRVRSLLNRNKFAYYFGEHEKK